MHVLALGLVLLFVLHPTPLGAQPAERRLALVISNGDYTGSLGRLENTHKDSETMGAALGRVGFDVTFARDLSKSALTDEMVAFVRRVRDAGPRAIAFFYYSGHGAADTSMNGENFLIPVGLPIQEASELHSNGFSLQTVVKSIESAVPAAAFIVIDACRNVAFPSATKSLSKGLLPEARTGGTLIAYATRPGDVAADNNLYSSVLAAEIEKPGQDAFNAFKETQLKVAAASANRQVPWLEDGLLARFSFRDGYSGPAIAAPAPATGAAATGQLGVAMTATESTNAATSRLPQAPSPDPTRPRPSQTVAIAPARDSAQAIFPPGSAVITRFSGLVTGQGPAGSMTLDLRGAIYDVVDVAQPSATQPTRLAMKSVAPPVINAGDIGQVFGVTFDRSARDVDGSPIDPPSLYLAATSAYGLPIVDGNSAIGNSRALERGESGATWAPGLFGVGKGGGPGSIWKVDGRTGAVSLFTNVTRDGIANAGPALGQLAFDPRTRQIFVSDRASGFIHRLSLKGTDLGTFDHGHRQPGSDAQPVATGAATAQRWPTRPDFVVSDAQTWGLADPPRRTWGLAVRADRLFYAVAAGPQVWSVGIGIDGAFSADARLEVDVKGVTSSAEVTRIGFDRDGKMLVALASGPIVLQWIGGQAIPMPATILRFERAMATAMGERWDGDAAEIDAGAAGDVGAAFDTSPDYSRAGRIDARTCGGTVWAAGQIANAGSDAALFGWPQDSGPTRSAEQSPRFIIPLGAAAASAPAAPVILGSLAINAPCAAPAAATADIAVPTAAPVVLAPAWETPNPVATLPAGPSGRTGGDAGPSRDPSRPPPGQPTGPVAGAGAGGSGSGGGGNRPPPACLVLEGAKFQCVAGAWEVEFFLEDAQRRPRDSLKVSSLVFDRTVSPSRARRADAGDPFRVRFDLAQSGSQVPIDVCLFDQADAAGGRVYRCCRAQINVTLPQQTCSRPPQQ